MAATVGGVHDGDPARLAPGRRGERLLRRSARRRPRLHGPGVLPYGAGRAARPRAARPAPPVPAPLGSRPYAGSPPAPDTAPRPRTAGNREPYEPALEKGEIGVVPEYAATLAEFRNVKANGPKAPWEKPVAFGDVAATVAALEKPAAPRGPEILPAGGAADRNAFAVSREFTARHKPKSLSDLLRSKLKVKIAAVARAPCGPSARPA